jgi:hypothetical protein
MYVTLEGKKISSEDIELYNSNKFAFIIYREFPYKLTHVNQFDKLDSSINSYNNWVNDKRWGWKVRRRVSNSGCEILYCLVGEIEEIINYYFMIPKPWKEIQAIDFKYFKEEVDLNPFRNTPFPDETLYYDEISDDESAWNNRLIRCKLVHNWNEDTIKEFDDFCGNVKGLVIEKNRPYIKALFDSQKTKDNVFEKMFEEYDNDGININYFRRELEWENVSLSKYERHCKITNGI